MEIAPGVSVALLHNGVGRAVAGLELRNVLCCHHIRFELDPGRNISHGIMYKAMTQLGKFISLSIFKRRFNGARYRGTFAAF